MKNNTAAYLLFGGINIAFLLCVYFFPVTRDGFYYLNKNITFSSWINEYYHSYFSINPRLGQLFCNLISRADVLKFLFELAVFQGYIICIFLLVFRRLPSIRSGSDVKLFIVLTAAFLFLIKYFGEFFLYTSFETNYTFTHIFYWIYIYIISEYYVGHRNILKEKNIYGIFILIAGFMTGMGNEHVPPVLLAVSFLGMAFNLYRNKKIDAKIIIYQFSLLAGYLTLFFAPANGLRYKNSGKEYNQFLWADYLSNFKKIISLFIYYNPEIIFALIVSAFLLCIPSVRKKIVFYDKKRILFFTGLGIIILPLVSFSPILGTRLLLFSNTLFIVVICIVFKYLIIRIKYFCFLYVASSVYLFVFFILGIIILARAHRNYKHVMAEIAHAAATSKNVEIESGFSYFVEKPEILNRFYLLENGQAYIDSDPNTDSSVEKNIKYFFNLEKISVKQEEGKK